MELKFEKGRTFSQYFFWAILLFAAGLSLNACQKTKKNSNNGGVAGQPGVYGVNNQGYATSGCPIPGNTSQVLRSSIGGDSVLTIYVVRSSNNRILLYGDLLMPATHSTPSFSTCLNPDYETITQSSNSTFENVTSQTNLVGNGISIQLIPGNTYLTARALMGQVVVASPNSSLGYGSGMYISLTGI